MSRLDEIKQEFTAINATAGQNFESALAALGSRIAPETLDLWAEQSLAIAASGWHAWETANVWCDISPDLADIAGAEGLLSCGDFGYALCGYSFEPSATWFRGIRRLLDDASLVRAAPVELAGRRVLGQFPQASGLLTDYLKTAFHVATHDTMDSLEDWVALTGDMVALSRAELMAFLAATREAGQIHWPFIRQVGKVSVEAGLDYMRASALRGLIPEDDRALLRRVVLRFAASGAKLAPWFESLHERLAGMSTVSRSQVLAWLDLLPRMELAQSLLSALDRLPLDRPALVDEWLKGVEAYLPVNIDAACGYLSLESATAVDTMQRLLGQVDFADCQRVLQLYSEAIVGKRLLVDVHGEQMDHFRGLPTTDGMSVYLPESISRYPLPEDNFALYKMSLLHQLGYYEFGTFNFTWGGSLIAFGDYFRTFGNPGLAADIFQVVEDARIDWALERRYRGAAGQLARFKRDALASLPAPDTASAMSVCMNALLRFSLDDTGPTPGGDFVDTARELHSQIARLAAPDADIFLTMEVLSRCYEIIAPHQRRFSREETPESVEVRAERPIIVEFRGRLEPDRARLNLALMEIDEEDVDVADEGEDSLTLSFPVDPKNVTIEQLKQGEVQEALGMMITDLEGLEAEKEELDEEQRKALEEFRGKLAERTGAAPDAAFRYDEWDCVIEDYRRRWCTLYEIRDLEEHPEFVARTLTELPDVARKVRRQLNNLKPELLRKIKGVEDGEDLDLERAVELLVDKKAGLVPEARIYVERLRKDRDVSALFLLDMSASTDDRIPEAEAEQRAMPDWDKDDFLHDYYGSKAEADQRKRIIDLEKEAVILMAEALEGLGDAYSVCGFSGYGKDQVDFYLCKDFEEPYNITTKGRIGGIKPCRSTRMGPAIRHATRRLVATESRIKAMIIISDGYPQDFDYGKDRNSKDYGIKDTTMALSEARQKGVQTFCLTVDPSGHDYLREMCPDQRYMVIQDINQLPDELSKVYRSLTG